MSSPAAQPTSRPRVAVFAALDTKGEEAAFLCAELRAAACSPLVVDIGVLGEPRLPADISRSAVATAGGGDLLSLQNARDAGAAIAVMARGLRQILRGLYDRGEVAAAIGLGGSKGAAVACEAMRQLPFSFPKVVVTPVASGNTRRFIGGSDILLVPTVADLLGLNRITRPILSSAAHIVAVLARQERTDTSHGPTIAVSSFGVTTPCVERVRLELMEYGLEVVVFPANGAGGQAMEELILAGEIDGVIDITTTELADELIGGICSAGPERLEAAGRVGIPQVVSLGALDMVNFGPPATLPPQFAGRRLYQHSPAVTLMRTTVEENQRLGEMIAEKLNRSSGPCVLVVPTRGFSDYDRPGGPFFDREADAACIAAIKSRIDDHVRLIVSDAHINDSTFANTLFEHYINLAGAKAKGGPPQSR